MSPKMLAGHDGRSPFFDVRPDKLDLRDREYRPPLVSLPPIYPHPDTIAQWLPSYAGDGMVLDQDTSAACTGYGLAAVVNFLLWRAARIEGGSTEGVQRVSPAMLYHAARLYDEWPGEDYEGSSCRGAMKGWHRHGACAEPYWGFVYTHGENSEPDRLEPDRPLEGWVEDATSRTLGAYYRINTDSIADMQAGIHEVGAIYVSARVHSGWGDLESGDPAPFIGPDAEDWGGHAFAIVGYTPAGFIVQNSWGPDWGVGGFAVLRYADWVANGMDAWIAVMGVPVDPASITSGDDQISRTPDLASRSNESLVRRAAGATTRSATGSPFVYAETQVMPWSESTAYHHSVVVGNNGYLINRIISATSPEAACKTVAHDLPAQWMSYQGSKDVVVYAHGGLNDEGAAVRRAQILGPYFKANGAYPIFITWRTGVLESIINILLDSLTRLPGTAPAAGLEEFFRSIGERLAEMRDRTIEQIAEAMLVKAVWTQMKQNAEAFGVDAPASGGTCISRCLRDLAKDVQGLRVHFVGHSAGSIILGHLLERLVKAVTVESITYWAPACSMAFAARTIGRAIQRGTVDPARVFTEVLTDEVERDDSAGPYGKSLLYLVSRALERYHKRPLLGLEIAWNPDNETSMWWPDAGKREIEAWHALEIPYENWNVLPPDGDAKVWNGEEVVDLAHGSFDNDIDVVTRVIRRTTGRSDATALPFAVETLAGF